METAPVKREKPKRITLGKLTVTDTSPTVAAAVGDYLNYHRRCRSSERYIEQLDYFLGERQKQHGSKFQPLACWSTSKGIARVSQLDRDALNAWLDHFLEVSTAGQHAKAAQILKRFLNFLVAEEVVPKLPMRVILPKTRQTEIQVFTPDEVSRIAAVVSKENVRDQAIYAVLVGTGIRCSELCGIRMQDVHWERGELFIRAAKGKKTRTVAFRDGMPLLRKYLKMRGESIDETDAFFLSFWPGSSPVYAGGTVKADRRTTSKYAFSTRPLTRVGLYVLVKKWGELAGVMEARCSPHTFRHFFAVQYLRNGGDLLQLKEILGHSKIETTMVYAKLADVDVKLSHNRHSPLQQFFPGRFSTKLGAA